MHRVASTLALVLLAAGCEKQQPPFAPPPMPGEAGPQADPSPSEGAPEAATPAGADRLDGGAEDVASDAAASVDAAVRADAAAGAGAPRVKVISIGMHVAGGPYDEETKKPFLAAVEPHYGELAECFVLVEVPKQADVGVDVLIPEAGGKARISNPRSTIPARDFLPCVVKFFEGITWDKPKSGGAQGLSYSVRFKPLPSKR